MPSGPAGAAALVPALALALALALAVAVVRRVEVEGDSMVPTLEAGDRLVVVRVPGAVRRALLRRPLLRPGLVVAALDPREPGRLLVKRVAGISAKGCVTLAGDNPARSTDSRTFGGVDPASILGPVLYRYAPAARAGRLPPLAPAPRGGDDR